MTKEKQNFFFVIWVDGDDWHVENDDWDVDNDDDVDIFDVVDVWLLVFL